LKVSTNVKIAMQCFENFGEENAPLVARLIRIIFKCTRMCDESAVAPIFHLVTPLSSNKDFAGDFQSN